MIEVTQGKFYCEERGSIPGRCSKYRPHDVAKMTASMVAQFLSERGRLSSDVFDRIANPTNCSDFEFLLEVIKESPHCDWDYLNYNPPWENDSSARTSEPYLFGHHTIIRGKVGEIHVPETVTLLDAEVEVEKKLLLPVPCRHAIRMHINNLRNPLCFSTDRDTVKQLNREIKEYFEKYCTRLESIGAYPPVELQRPLHNIRDFSARDLSTLIELITTTSTIVFRADTPSHVARTQVTSTFDWVSDSLANRENYSESLVELAKKCSGIRIPILYLEWQDYNALIREQERLRTTSSICRCTLF